MRHAARDIADIPRNDVEACRLYFEAHGVTVDEWQMMLMLQDDPSTLASESKSWRRTAEI